MSSQQRACIDLLDATTRLYSLGLQYRISVCTRAVYIYTFTINGGDLSVVDICLKKSSKLNRLDFEKNDRRTRTCTISTAEKSPPLIVHV